MDYQATVPFSCFHVKLKNELRRKMEHEDRHVLCMSVGVEPLARNVLAGCSHNTCG